MKLDGFGKIPFLHRRVDGPLNTMIPHDESRIDALHLAGNVRWRPALIAEAFTPARKPLLDDPRFDEKAGNSGVCAAIDRCREPPEGKREVRLPFVHRIQKLFD